MPNPTASQTHIDYALSDIAIGYFQERPPFSDLMFPRVTENKQSNKFFVWSKADLFRDNAAKRAPGTDFAQISIGLSNDSYQCDEYALEYPIPDEKVANEDDAVRLQEVGTRTIYSQLALKKDRAFASDFVKTGVWATDVVGGTDFVQWNDVTSDPASNMQTGLETLLNATGEIDGMRTRLLIGSAVRAVLVNHPDAIDRIKYVQKADVAAVDGILAAWLGVDELIVARRRYTTSAEGAATATYAAVVGKSALLVAVPDGPGIDIPSAGYTFEWNEKMRGPMYVETYRHEPKKSDVVRGITHFDQKVVAADLGYYFSQVIA